ncbi:unnamed protein product [Adineta steineri]|uniref:FAM20 C-terminal domain-containing protein n=2 Tax=Adineta steineri TaxID=433720 RepID=A0A815P0F9_9BILA|nr:unnamed protein product [Adineta steineri]CAF1077035.1 unnamed protein product [Adineta steineri]CAF1438752.1 unnamed protein product [Adineta steineri]
MRYLRLRLRSSILLSITIFVIVFITLHVLIWSTNEFELLEKTPESVPKPPVAISFLSALDQPNIYDLKASQSHTLNKHSSYITSHRIHELFQLVRTTRNNQLKSNSINSTWNFGKFIPKKVSPHNNNTKTNVDTADSVTMKEKNHKLQFNITTTAKIMNEQDKIQLRHFIHYTLTKWKADHENDKYVNLADIMHDGLAQDEPELNTTWFKYIKTVTNSHVYNPNTPEFKHLLNHLQNGKISEASEMSQGTQIKVILNLPNGFQGLLKPYRVPRNYQTQPDHFYFSDIERHHAEIAAFHVDKILGFNRVPPLIGRLLNITSDLRDKATEELAKTFFISPANNTCFRGHCSYYCDTSHAICGKPGDQLEGSVQVLLPRPPEVDWQKISHPYRRSYSATRTAQWETNENYCYEHVMIDEDYHNRLLLDMMDLAAFDFLIGNLDRHHMMRISAFGINTALVHLDNGRSFGRYDADDLSILAPIRQCCFFRYSTFARLYRVYNKGLSKLVSDSLNTTELLQMILVNEHLIAIDRRLEILFSQIDICIKTYTVQGVMIDDGID